MIRALLNHHPATTLELVLRPLVFKICPIMKHGWAPTGIRFEACTLMDADVASIESYFKSPQFAGAIGWGINSFERYERCLGIIEKWEEVDAPALCLNEAGDGLKIIDGRHRLQALRDLGYSVIKIAAPEAQVARIGEILEKYTCVTK